MGSPPHSHSNSSLGPHSRESSSTRFSASLKPSSRKNIGSQRKGWKPWKDQFDSIEEEGLLNDDDGRHGLTRRCYLLAFVVGFFVLFSFFSLILWGASRPQKPIITMKVPTYFISIFNQNIKKKKEKKEADCNYNFVICVLLFPGLGI
jgi:hypothetical protein